MIAVWRIASDAPGYTADDLSGAGAKLSGGRWNRPDMRQIAARKVRKWLYDPRLVETGRGP